MTNFGDLNTGLDRLGSLANDVDGYNFGGASDTSTLIDDIGKITIQTPGNESVLGQLSSGNLADTGCYNNSLFGWLMGGKIDVGSTDDVLKWVFADESEEGGFATLLEDITDVSAGSNETRGVRAGGRDVGDISYKNTIEFFEIADGGALTDFGDLAVRRSPDSSACSQIEMIIPYGEIELAVETDVISKIDFATEGNDSAFGTVTQAMSQSSGYGGSP